jgi:DNA-binding CsgD family transcriptional regulator
MNHNSSHLLEIPDIPKSHITFTSIETLKDIMMPKLTPHGITVFRYYRIYFDGSFIRLSTDREWTEHYFKKKYFATLTLPKNYSNYFIWLIEDCPEMLLDAALNFDIANGITIAKKLSDSIEYFAFGTSRNNQSIINTFYLNNLDLLQQYCLYFKEHTKAFIDLGEKNKILMPTSKTKPTEILTDNQLACSSLFLRGMTCREIAEVLKRSPRTIETNLNNLKIKFDCRNNIELALKLSHFIKN